MDNLNAVFTNSLAEPDQARRLIRKWGGSSTNIVDLLLSNFIMIIKQQGYNNDMRMESNSSLWTGADAEISIIIIIITHTKIGAQQKKKYINDYMDQ